MDEAIHNPVPSTSQNLLSDTATSIIKSAHTSLGRSVLADNIPLSANEERGPTLDRISSVDVFAKHSAVLSSLRPGTGQWLIETEDFKAWLRGRSKFLWLPGIPGAGKTVLASLVIEHLRAIQRGQSTSTIGLAWVYYNYKEESTQTPDAVLLSITRQLVGSSTELYSHFKSAYKDPHKRPTSNELLSDGILMRAFEQVFVVVDALDECAETNRNVFLRMMAHLQTSGASIIVTGRDHVSEYITKSGSVDIQRIEIRASPEDITKYVQDTLVEPTRLGSVLQRHVSLRDEIIKTIAESSQGMFLLATLQIQSLRKHTSVDAVRRALIHLPKTIPGIYDEAMHRIQKDDRSEDALSILSYLIYARRPLRLEELQHLLAVQPGQTFLDEDCIMERSTLVSMCVGLVVVDDDTNIVRLVHFTTQEYFDQSRETRFPLGNQEMGCKCLIYLSLDTLKDPAWRYSYRHVLLDYIVEYWHFHVLPHQQALRQLLSNKPNFNVEGHGELGETPLVSASRGGYEAAVTLLLDHGAKVNETNRFGTTALMAASKEAHVATVVLLLKGGADVDKQDAYYNTPLIWASEKGHTTVVRLLCEHGASIKAGDKDGITGLMSASMQGQVAVAEMLLTEFGAEIDAQDCYGQTALIWASMRGSTPMIELLLQHGANIELREEEGNTTALMWASRGGNAVDVKLLLEHNADVEARDHQGRNALMYASDYEKDTVVKLLLEHSNNIDRLDRDRMAVDDVPFSVGQ
ncbi:ankyrin repeat-containing domain protein [Mycena crocata]|nr:ankyrin repeat-containing domain protein [Mycena crocata]